MTSDIAQRLRAVAGERYSEGANKRGTAGLLEDAATEIDRLRARLNELEGQEPWAYGWEYMGEKHVTQSESHAERMAEILTEQNLSLIPLYTAPPAGRSEDVVKAEGLEDVAQRCEDKAAQLKAHGLEHMVWEVRASFLRSEAARLRGDGEES